MTPRNLFLVVLKLFGLYFIREFFILTSQILPAFYFYKTGQTTEALWTVISTTIALAIEALAIYYLLFKTEWIIDKLKLTEGFDQATIPFNMHRSTVVQIAVIIIGGLLVVDEVPNLFRRAINFYQGRSINNSDLYNREVPYIVVSIVKITLAILILKEQRKIVSLILRNTNPAAEVEANEE